MHTRAVLVVLSPIFLTAACGLAKSPELKVTPLTPAARVGEVCEFRVDAPVAGGDPYDPASMALDAESRLAGGGRVRMPGFYIVPHRAVTIPPPRRICRLMRIFFPTDRFGAGRKVRLLLDDIRLVERDTGKVTVFDDFEGEARWEAVGTQAAVETARVHGGRRALHVELTVPKGVGWPGVNWQVPNADWQRVQEIRLWVMPLEGIGPGMPMIEFWTPDNAKFQGPLDLTGMEAGKWHEGVWRVPTLRKEARFRPAGGPQWRVRFMPLATGRCTARFTWKGPGGARSGEHTFDVADAKTDGFIRVSPKDARYLAFQSGRPFFPIGMNLIGRELEHYRYYLDILARHRCNFIRLWLSPRSMGFELKPGRYEQDRAAQLDALVEDCRRRGIYLMACITDYREACAFDRTGYWKDSPFNAANGGPCKTAREFFTSPKAAELYRRKLRYQVARWGAYPTVMSWEFFNEVNITDGWKNTPEAVRAWHEKMAAYLRGLDPYGRIITSSFAGIPDDALWTQPNMQIVQKHLYLRPGTSFVPTAAEATRLLAGHGKPVLIGEFGRSNKVSHRYDADGVGLHNGLWASVMSGGCGTAMTWWWQWLDQYDQWGRFSSLARFVEGVDFPAEAFTPLSGRAVAAVAAGDTLPPGRIVPNKVSWKPAPFNRPHVFRLTPEGKLDKPHLLSRLLHGKRNHPKLHNPITFVATFRRAGRFTVDVQEVSKHGGAALEIRVDGKLVLKKGFLYGDDPKQPTRPYAGRYSVDVAAGEHAIQVVCTGNDWINVRAYEFDGVQVAPPIRLMGLRGRRTALVWLWNETHVWAHKLTGQRATRLIDVSAELEKVPPGTWRVRPYDPWAGKWGEPHEAAVGPDGKLRLRLKSLDRDFAWRLEKAR